MHDSVLFNIKEVAEQVGVVPGTIRNWERQGLFKAKRGKNRYRVFDFEDIERLRHLKELSKTDNLGIKAIRMLCGEEARSKEPKNAVSKKLLGQKWRGYRTKKGYLLEDVAKAVGISASYLSKIENPASGVNVSFRVLQKLAKYYGENILYYVNDAEEEAPLVRKGSGERLRIGIDGVDIESLVSRGNMRISSMLYTVEPGAGSLESSIHTGEEFIHILSGKVRFVLHDTGEYLLKPGDSLSFHSREPHQWQNVGEKDARILWMYIQDEQ